MKLKATDYGILFVGVFLGWMYTKFQRFYVMGVFARPAIFVVYLFIALLVFIAIKPAKPYVFSKLLSIWVSVAALVILFVDDFLIKQIPLEHLIYGTAVVLLATIITPYIAGYLYIKARE